MYLGILFTLQCNYYRQFIKNFSLTALPLLRYLQGKKSKHDKIEFDDAAVNSFNELKNCLCNSPILCYPDFAPTSKPMILGR